MGEARGGDESRTVTRRRRNGVERGGHGVLIAPACTVPLSILCFSSCCIKTKVRGDEETSVCAGTKKGVALGFTEKKGKAHGREEEVVKAVDDVQVLPSRMGGS